MTWIRMVDESTAEGELKGTYDQIHKSRGKIANIMRVHSLNPAALRDHMTLYRNLMFMKMGLNREDRELIAVVVSNANDCSYCVSHHGEALNHYWKDQPRVRRVSHDFTLERLPERQLRMLEYADKLTRTPMDMDASDVENLREVGFTDEDILNINLITSYFNFVNRIALGLGVDFTEDEVADYRY